MWLKTCVNCESISLWVRLLPKQACNYHEDNEADGTSLEDNLGKTSTCGLGTVACCLTTWTFAERLNGLHGALCSKTLGSRCFFDAHYLGIVMVYKLAITIAIEPSWTILTQPSPSIVVDDMLPNWAGEPRDHLTADSQCLSREYLLISDCNWNLEVKQVDFPDSIPR